MKNKRRLLFILLSFCILLLSGCSAADVVRNIKTPDQDQLMAQVFNAFENEDYEYISQVMHEDVLNYEGTDLTPISDYIQGEIKDYEKTGYYYNVSSGNEDDTVTQQLTYNVNTESERYVVSMVLLQTDESEWKVYGYNIVLASELEGNGAIINFKNFDIVQLLMLVFSSACIGFVVYAIVACAKAPIRLKALWIIVIILLQSGITLTLGSPRFGINFWFLNLNISSLQKYIDGTSVLTILIPLGAILFVCLKKRLIASAARWKEKQEALKAQQMESSQFNAQENINENAVQECSEGQDGTPLDQA